MLRRLSLAVALLLASVQAQAAYQFEDITCEFTQSTGTGSLDLDGPISPYLGFASTITSGNTVPISIESSDGKVELGTAVFTNASPDTLTSRTASWSTDGVGAELNLPAGQHRVCVYWNTDTWTTGVFTPYVAGVELSHATQNTLTGSGGHLLIEGNTVWDSANDGSGSGLDADLLDNISSAAFALDADIGVTIQAWDADLDSWRAITRASGFDTFVATPSSANLRGLLTDEIDTGVLVFLGTPADDQVSVGDSASDTTWRTVPDSDGATQKLQYDQATNTFSAGTDDDVPESGDFGALTGGDGITNSAGTLSFDITEAEDDIEPALDTLANLTSIQGFAFDLDDNNLDELWGWDDSAATFDNFSLADITTETAPAAGDFLLLYLADGNLAKSNWNELFGHGGIASDEPDLGGFSIIDSVQGTDGEIFQVGGAGSTGFLFDVGSTGTPFSVVFQSTYTGSYGVKLNMYKGTPSDDDDTLGWVAMTGQTDLGNQTYGTEITSQVLDATEATFSTALRFFTMGSDVSPGGANISRMQIDASGVTIDRQGALRWAEAVANGANYVEFISPASLTANRTCIFQNTGSPIPDSCVGDGVDAGAAAGVSVSGTPADGQVAVWTGASAIEGDASFTFDTSTNRLDLGEGTGQDAIAIMGVATTIDLYQVNDGSGGALVGGGLDSNSLAATDVPFVLYGYVAGDDDFPTIATIEFVVADATNDAEVGQLDFKIYTGGVSAVEWQITSAALQPGTDGANDIGTATLGVNNIFLDTGAVLNFENGDVTITHSANDLSFSGVTGDYSFDDTVGITGSLTASVDVTATAGDVTSGDDLISGDDVLLSNAGVVNFGSGDCTLTEGTDTLTIAGTCTLVTEVVTPDGDNTRDLGSTGATWATFHATSWEVGNATDTTIARSGAGTLTVESVGIVRGATGGTDNAILRADGTGGTLLQNSVLVIADTSGAISGAASGFSIEFFGASGTDTTLTAPSAGDLNIEGNRIYRAGGTDVALADGGTGASLADPGADRIMWWDESDNAIELTSLSALATEAAPANGDFLLMVDAAGVLLKVDWASLPSGSGISAVVEDTSPQLGGPLDFNGQYAFDATLTNEAHLLFREAGAEAGAQITYAGPTWLEIKAVDDGAAGAALYLWQDSASSADGDIPGAVYVQGGADEETIGSIQLEIDDGATTTEDTKWLHTVRSAGADRTLLTVGGNANPTEGLLIAHDGTATYADFLTTGAGYGFSVTADDDGAAGPYLGMSLLTTSPAAGDLVGEIPWGSFDSDTNFQHYAKIYGYNVSPTSTAEYGRILATVWANGSETNAMQLGDVGFFRFFENDTNGANYVELIAPASLTANRQCVFQDSGPPIPDSCVGDGSDSGGSLADADYGDITVSSSGTVWNVDPVITVDSTADAVDGIVWTFEHSDPTPDAGDDPFDIVVNAGDDQEKVGGIQLELVDDATTTEDSSWIFSIDVAGANVDVLTLEAAGATVVGKVDASTDVDAAGDLIAGDDVLITDDIDFGAGDVQIVYAANDLHFQGVTGDYAFDDTVGITGSLTASVDVTATAGDVTSGDDLISGDDVLLSDAGVINFNAGDCTLTEGTNTLTIAGTCTLTTEVLIPDGDNTRDLGSAAATWATAHINSIELANGTANTLTATGGVLSIEGAALVPTSITLTAGTGLSGGGDLSANRSFALDTTEVSSATWGAGSFTTFTFDAGATDPTLTFGSGTATLEAIVSFRQADAANAGGQIRLLEDPGTGSNYIALAAPSSITSDVTCTLENDSNPIPDSCVGDGTDGGGSPTASSQLETELKASSSTYIQPATMDSYDRGTLTGLTLSNNAGDTVNDIDIDIGVAAAATTPYPLMNQSTAALTKRLDAAWAVGDGNGCLDATESVAGTPDVSTWYHLWLVMRSDTGVVDVVCSESATSPSIDATPVPVAYDFYRRIGSVYNNSSGDVRQFTQNGDTFLWASRVTDRNADASDVAWTLIPVSTPLGVKTQPIVVAEIVSTTGGAYIEVGDATWSTETNLYYGAYTFFGSDTQTGNVIGGFFTDTSSQIRYRFEEATTATGSLYTSGWIDSRDATSSGSGNNAIGSVGAQVFTSGSGTYTPTTGTKYVKVTCTGQGGGGGGADSAGTPTDTGGAGGGGEAGGTAIIWYDLAELGANAAYDIGDAANLGGSATNGTAGTDGDDTTFNPAGTGATITGAGGDGGDGSGVPGATTTASGVGGNAEGTATNGDINIIGGPGMGGNVALDVADDEEGGAFGGQGGGSMWGGGGRGGITASGAAANTAGDAGQAPGSGGGGGGSIRSATGAAGGTGANGICMVEEFGG